jgi:outer membrane protein assembly factor BamB/tetratricopeptide (TPR) repeat protein
MMHPWRLLPAALLLLSAVSPLPAAAAPEPPPAPEAAILAIDPTLRRKIETARDYIADRSWAQAVRLLQAVLEAEQDSFMPVGKKPDGRPLRWVGARAEAERILAALPVAGREYYQLTYEGEARRRQDGGLAALRETARLYRCTPAGAAALQRLGAYLLDRGDADLAAGSFRRMLQAADLFPSEPSGLLQAALAFRGSGDTASEEAAWDALAHRLGERPFRLRTRSLKVADLRREVADLPLRPGPNEDWPLFRGDRHRSGAGEGVAFLLDSTRRIPTAAPEAYQLLLRAARNATPGPVPAAVPLAVGGRIVYRGTAGIQAIDADSGRELWRTLSPLALETLLRDYGKKVQVLHWLSMYGEAGSVLYENSTIGTLSTDGRRVYAIEDLPLPPHPDLISARQSGATRSFGPLQTCVEQNRLRALDLATGALAWEVGGVAPHLQPTKPGTKPAKPARRPAADPLAGGFFLGPPLPLAGEVFVLLDRDGEVLLACLGAERGELHWTQPLVAGKSLLEEVSRRTNALHLACADGVLVCPTGRGTIIGIDPVSRQLLWAHVYRDFSQAVTSGAPGFIPLPSWPGALRGCSPLIADGRVVFTSAEHDAIECVRLRDGVPLWKAGRGEGDIYVAGVLSGKVLVVGRSACRALDLSDGRTVWERPTPLPSGQGIASAGTYYLPLQDGGVLAIDVAEPRRSHKVERPAGSRGVQGNLVFHRGLLWVQGIDQLAAYPSQAYRLAQVEERLVRGPAEPRLLLERGRLWLDRGDTARAAADLHAAIAGNLPGGEAVAARRDLFRALGRLLRQDFSAAEKYLDTYRSLCETLPGGGVEERRRRLLELEALIACGRQHQGRLGDDLRACRSLLDRSLARDLFPSPEDPSLEVRPDAWVREHLGELSRSGPPLLRQALSQERDRAWHALDKEDDQAVERLTALFGAVPGSEGRSSLRLTQLQLAQRLLRSPYRGNGLVADLLLGMAAEPRGEAPPALAAEALRLRAELLTQHGRLADAADCYRSLKSDFPAVRIGDDRTTRELLAEALLDKRLLPYLDTPQKPRWQRRVLRPVERPGGPRHDPLILHCDPRQPFPPAAPGSLGPVMPASCRNLRFLLEARQLHLVAQDRHSGQERFRIPLPLARFPETLRGAELPIGGIDHLLLLPVGQHLVAIDLLDRRVRWTRDVLDGDLARAQVNLVLGDGRLQITLPDGTARTAGWLGPVRRNAVFAVTGAGLVCLDPASGEVRWRRKDAPANFDIFGDEETIYAVETGMGDAVGTMRGYRISDGATVPAGRAAVYERRVRTIGARLLSRGEGLRGGLRVYLHDIRAGKDVWSRDFPAGSKLLDASRTPWCAVASPDGKVALLSLDSGTAAGELPIDPRHMEKATATVLADPSRVYIAWAADDLPDAAAQAAPQCRTGLPGVKVNGVLYAFDRRTGVLRWTSATPLQHLILEQFEELPILLFATRVMQRTTGPGGVVTTKALRSLDRRTGKVLCQREFPPEIELFESVRSDPHAGTIDLIGPTLVLRHQPAGK